MNYNKRINWNIGGAFSKARILTEFFAKNGLLNKFGSITVYDGLEDCEWNGGRVNFGVKYDPYTHDLYRAMGWNIALTLSNPVIDLTDNVGNFLLRTFHEKGNAVILVNDQLRKYIKDRFPKYDLIYSVTGLGDIQESPLTQEDRSKIYQLMRTHNRVVTRCGSTFEPELRNLLKHKIEIMVNDTCFMNCEHFGDHFERIAEVNRDPDNYTKQEKEKIAECWYGLDTMLDAMEAEREQLGDKYPFDLNVNQISRLIEEGFTNFKISGRDESDCNFTNELKKFLIPDYGPKQ